MPPSTHPYTGDFERADGHKSVVVNLAQAVDGNYPALRFPAAGRVVGAYLFANVAASGTNIIQAGLRNGGVTGAGTIITAPVTSGTLLAGSAYAISLSMLGQGPESYEAGEYCMIELQTDNATVDISVQVDYRIDP